MVNNLLITVHAFPMHMLKSLSVDELLVPRYLKWSNDFKSLLFNVEMTPFGLKCINSVLSEFT